MNRQVTNWNILYIYMYTYICVCLSLRLYTHTVRKPCHGVVFCCCCLFVSLKDWKQSLGGMPKEIDCGASESLTRKRRVL